MLSVHLSIRNSRGPISFITWLWIMSFLRPYVTGIQHRGFCRVCQSRGLSGTVQPRWRVVPHRHRPSSLWKITTAPLSSQAQTVPADTAMEVESKPVGHPWRIVTGVCVQRFPTLSPSKTDLEQRFEELQSVMKMERSRLSDFELEEAEYLRKKKERDRRAQEEDLDQLQLEGVEEFEDLLEAREAELQAFEPFPRETEADRNDDRRSLNRRLDRMLYLLVKKPRKEHAWQMPQGEVEEEESLLEAAKRELREECGSRLQVTFFSGSPLAFFSYKHPPVNSKGRIGSKVFFLKAQCSGSLAEVELDDKELEDFMWVTKEEMKDYVSQEYYAAVSPMLMN